MTRLETFRETHSKEITLLRKEMTLIRHDVSSIVASISLAKWIISTAIALGPALGVGFARLFG